MVAQAHARLKGPRLWRSVTRRVGAEELETAPPCRIYAACRLADGRCVPGQIRSISYGCRGCQQRGTWRTRRDLPKERDVGACLLSSAVAPLSPPHPARTAKPCWRAARAHTMSTGSTCGAMSVIQGSVRESIRLGPGPEMAAWRFCGQDECYGGVMVAAYPFHRDPGPGLAPGADRGCAVAKGPGDGGQCGRVGFGAAGAAPDPCAPADGVTRCGRVAGAGLG